MKRYFIPILAIVLCSASFSSLRADDQPAPKPADANPNAQDTVTVDEKTEAVIKGALKYLASQQQPSGAWSRDQNQTGITGYVMMAFMASGELPGEGQYSKNVNKGLQYILDSVRPDGYIAGPNDDSKMYGHGICTIVLAELYGQTRDPAIRPKLEQAVKLIVSCQNDQGGWRYQPHRADADISVTVLQVVALRAAKNSGIDVPQSTIDAAIRFIKSCAADDKQGGFCYQPHGQPGFARTAAAIYSLQVCGLYDDPLVKSGSKFLMNRYDDREWFTYGVSYATPAEYMIGGDSWKKWYDKIHKELMIRVITEMGGMKRWDSIEGRHPPVYATAVYTTILAMPYHYIPLYQR